MRDPRTEKPRMTVIVVGAGIGGLTAAIALARAGMHVEVLEQAARLGAVGAGVTLAPNAMRVFQHLGLGEKIAAAGVEPVRQRVQHWQDGRTLVSLERGACRDRYGAPYVYIHRADLQAILTDAIGGADAVVRLGSSVKRVQATATEATVTLATGEVRHADLVVGADGIKSAVRHAFNAAPPSFSGHVAWRAVIPVDTPRLAELAGYPGIHIGPGRMMVRYPLRGGTLMNVVCFARAEAWADEGWSIPAVQDEVRREFAGWCGEVQSLIEAMRGGSLYKWGIFAHAPLPAWIRDGRIGLLGDAAHAMTPFLGQGAACAVEDGLVLARVLRAAGVVEALGRYQDLRRARCDFIQAESNRNADRLQGQQTDLFGLEELRNEETLGLFEYDAGTVPV